MSSLRNHYKLTFLPVYWFHSHSTNRNRGKGGHCPNPLSQFWKMVKFCQKSSFLKFCLGKNQGVCPYNIQFCCGPEFDCYLWFARLPKLHILFHFTSLTGLIMWTRLVHSQNQSFLYYFEPMEKCFKQESVKVIRSNFIYTTNEKDNRKEYSRVQVGNENIFSLERYYRLKKKFQVSIELFAKVGTREFWMNSCVIYTM